MALKFGTSGVRGLVTEMTDRECYRYARAFARYLESKAPARRVALAGDYRNSTPRIMRAVAFAMREEGMQVDACGTVPTPAVIHYGIRNDMASVMVTGSHIPDDRNGIKFNMPWGEVLKEDEKEISARYASIHGGEESGESVFADDGSFKNEAAPPPETSDEARDDYVERYLKFFRAGCLSSLRIVFYQHSSVSREILPHILEELGADVVRVGFSNSFVALDTEAVDDPERLAEWVEEHDADALVSTDGDGDRPLVVDERGEVMRGDILGILVADGINADTVVTPVSSNTALEKSGRFKSTLRTRIGSPYVIASMDEALRRDSGRVVGYEANGGFLTASDISDTKTHALLTALPTRDAALPILAVLLSSLQKKKTLSGLAGELPSRSTMSGLMRDFPNELGKAIVEAFHTRGTGYADEVFSSAFGRVASMDFTDGARITFSSGDIVHLRPSGNAPEFRCYTESSSEEKAAQNNHTALEIVTKLRGTFDRPES